MPKNFPEIWLDRVIKNLTTLNVAPWLDGIPELDVDVTQFGAGSASEKNTIHIPRSMFAPEVLINNTTYPIALQAYTDDEVTINLDKFQTKVTTLSDDQIVGASYDKIDVITKGHTVQIASSKYKKAIHAIAPSADSVDTPVLKATGDPLVAGGRKTLTYADLVTAKTRLGKSGGECPAENRRLVLCPDHYDDLLRDRKNFGDQLVNYKTGDVAPVIAGFEIYQYVGNPMFDSSGNKKAFGSINAATDVQASVMFYTPNIAKKTGLTKQYFAEAKIDPENQVNKLNYRHYFIALPAQAKYVGAII